MTVSVEENLYTKCCCREETFVFERTIPLLHDHPFPMELKRCPFSYDDRRPHANERPLIYCSRKMFLCFSVMLLFHLQGVNSAEYVGGSKQYYTAFVNITYTDPETNEVVTSEKNVGRMSFDSTRKDPQTGIVVHVKSSTPTNNHEGCTDFSNDIPKEKWIALIRRGTCEFHEKIYNAAKKYNASAVVIYNNSSADEDLTMKNKYTDVMAIFVNQAAGKQYAQLADSGMRVMMKITLGSLQTENPNHTSISKTSVLFVSISFIVLMIISLAWLVFYYIQRFRYAHAKERLCRRLANAAKKAIAKIPMRSIKTGDKELDNEFDQCAVCIEGYKAHDVIRILPCSHVFHKSCVDPWLLDQRSCPMCKMDILSYYGMHPNGDSHDSVQRDTESILLETGNIRHTVRIEPEASSITEELGAVGGVKIVLLDQHSSIHYFPDEFDKNKSLQDEKSALLPSCSKSTDSVFSLDSQTSSKEAESLMSVKAASSVDSSD